MVWLMRMHGFKKLIIASVAWMVCLPLLLPAQDEIRDTEMELSEAVGEWRSAAAALDAASLKRAELQVELEDLKRAGRWFEENLHGATSDKRRPARLRRQLRKWRREVRRAEKKLAAQDRRIEDLTVAVDEARDKLDRLSFKRKYDALHRESAERVYSGYFPPANEFYYPDDEDKVLKHPPPFECRRAYDGSDPKLERHRIDLEEEPFFVYHPEHVPLFGDDEPLLRCAASLTLIEGGQYFLNLRFRIHTHQPRKAYGYLERGSRLIITFLDGTELTLRNNRLNLGQFDKKNGIVTFVGQYSLDLYAQNLLKRNMIRNVLVEWAKGYDKYPVYRIDLLANQMDCL